MKSTKIENCNVFPVMFDEGILFKDNENFYLWKENNLKSIELSEIKEIHYPESLEEVKMILNVIDFIYLRVQTTANISKDFIKIITDIKNNQEFIKKELLKANL